MILKVLEDIISQYDDLCTNNSTGECLYIWSTTIESHNCGSTLPCAITIELSREYDLLTLTYLDCTVRRSLIHKQAVLTNQEQFDAFINALEISIAMLLMCVTWHNRKYKLQEVLALARTINI